MSCMSMCAMLMSCGMLCHAMLMLLYHDMFMFRVCTKGRARVWTGVVRPRG